MKPLPMSTLWLFVLRAVITNVQISQSVWAEINASTQAATPDQSARAADTYEDRFEQSAAATSIALATASDRFAGLLISPPAEFCNTPSETKEDPAHEYGNS